MRILAAHRLCADAAASLRRAGTLDMNECDEPWSAAELGERAAHADALMVFMTETVGETLLARAPRLRIVAGALKGANNIDVAACTRRGVLVTVVPDLLTAPTAELTVGMTIAVMRNLVAGDALVKAGAFSGWRPQLYGRGLDGATVGVIGAGAVGRAVMARLSGFGATLVYVETAEDVSVPGAERVTQDALLARAHVVILALPLTEETVGLVGAPFLARMRRGAVLVNPARGSLVDEEAVVEALERGRLGGYAADVFAFEDWSLPTRPAQISARLLSAPNVVLTPHIGSAVTAVREAIERSAAASIVEVLQGGVPASALNAEALR